MSLLLYANLTKFMILMATTPTYPAAITHNNNTLLLHALKMASMKCDHLKLTTANAIAAN